MDKLKLLITYQHVHIGGATTSLINFLQCLDYDKYNVDLLFYENDHSIDDKIPEEVNILPQGKIHKKLSVGNIIKKIASPSYVWAKLRENYAKKIEKNEKKGIQIMSKEGCRYSRKIEKEYDVAVAYDMNWPYNYMMKFIKAKRKILWMHLDFHASGLSFDVDKKNFEKTDMFVFVSEQCRENFSGAHKEFQDKCVYMPNLMTKKGVLNLAAENVSLPFEKDETALSMVTVARIDFPHKGIDRAVAEVKKLISEGFKIQWLIIGDGPDREALETKISDLELSESIYYIGEKKNPIPYLKHCDIFFLPSHFEGKPMAVTEAQIMGLVPVVCSYASAGEQIENGVDGIITENSNQGIYDGLRELLENPYMIKNMKEAVDKKDYGNEEDIKIFDDIVIGLR